MIENKNNHPIINNIHSLLQSELSAYKIEQQTGINRSTIARLRNGKIEINNLTLENALKLNNLWEEYKKNI